MAIPMVNYLKKFFMASLLFALGAGHAATDLSEVQIKSTYVLNFIKFTEWPAGITEDEALTICVLGNNVLEGMLSTLDGRKVDNHSLRVVQTTSADSNLKSCRVLFIGESEHRHFASIIKALGDSPVLTISDIEDFAEKGGCIGLRYRNKKIVFEVNMTSLRNSGLSLPGQLLNLAYYVFGR